MIITIMIFVILIFLALAVVNGHINELVSLKKIEIGLKQTELEIKQAELNMFSGKDKTDER